MCRARMPREPRSNLPPGPMYPPSPTPEIIIDRFRKLKQSTILLHKIAGLPPVGKSALYKYSLLDDERRGIDRLIAAAQHADLAVFWAVLTLLRQAFKYAHPDPYDIPPAQLVMVHRSRYTP